MAALRYQLKLQEQSLPGDISRLIIHRNLSFWVRRCFPVFLIVFCCLLNFLFLAIVNLAPLSNPPHWTYCLTLVLLNLGLILRVATTLAPIGARSIEWRPEEGNLIVDGEKFLAEALVGVAAFPRKKWLLSCSEAWLLFEDRLPKLLAHDIYPARVSELAATLNRWLCKKERDTVPPVLGKMDFFSVDGFPLRLTVKREVGRLEIRAVPRGTVYLLLLPIVGFMILKLYPISRVFSSASHFFPAACLTFIVYCLLKMPSSRRWILTADGRVSAEVQPLLGSMSKRDLGPRRVASSPVKLNSRNLMIQFIEPDQEPGNPAHTFGRQDLHIIYRGDRFRLRRLFQAVEATTGKKVLGTGAHFPLPEFRRPTVVADELSEIRWSENCLRASRRPSYLINSSLFPVAIWSLLFGLTSLLISSAALATSGGVALVIIGLTSFVCTFFIYLPVIGIYLSARSEELPPEAEPLAVDIQPMLPFGFSEFFGGFRLRANLKGRWVTLATAQSWSPLEPFLELLQARWFPADRLDPTTRGGPAGASPPAP